MAVSVSCRVSSHKTLAKIVYVLDLSHKCYTESDDHGPSRTMHDTPQEQPPRSLLKWKGVDQDGQSWVAIAICLSHTHARTLYTHARTHALTPRTHMHACMHACMHAHTHTRIHAHLTRASTSANCRVEGYDARQAARCFGLLVLHTCTNMPNQMCRSMCRSRQLGVQACGEAHTTR